MVSHVILLSEQFWPLQIEGLEGKLILPTDGVNPVQEHSPVQGALYER